MTTPSPSSRLGLFARGVKVLDLSAFLPGPLASLLLADMGAEVLKIEPPTGDAMATIGPRDASGRPVFYETVNAGKRVRQMDLKQPAARAEFLCLAAEADVLIDGFRPGVMQRLGIGAELLRAINPGLIICSLSGYGATGPRAMAAGHDANYLAEAGVLHRNGQDAPVIYDPPVSDVSGSLFGVIAILGALRAREVDGRGCEIDIALADTAMPLQLFPIAEHGSTGAVPQPRATYLNGGAAYYQVYPTADGRHVALGAIEAKFWQAFCTTAGLSDWIARQSEALPQTALIADVAAFFASLSLADCLARFADTDCCLSPVRDLGEAIASPHHTARGLVRRSAGGALQALFPALIDGVAPVERAPLAHFQPTGITCPT